LLKKPIDIEKIRRYVEHCEKCMAMFLRGFFDSEGSVSEDGYITAYNSNYELLLYGQELLKRFGIPTTGPWCTKRQGTPVYVPKRGKQYQANRDCYKIYIRAEGNANFYLYAWFMIQRKRARLEDYLTRMRIFLPTP
jgi:intein-encoded DNA endonuclease-like protein